MTSSIQNRQISTAINYPIDLTSSKMTEAILSIKMILSILCKIEEDDRAKDLTNLTATLPPDLRTFKN
jgi:hypothetical protein